MLSETQRETFEARGLLKLEGALSAKAVAIMRDAVWKRLENRAGVLRDDSATWTVVRPSKQLKQLSKARIFDEILTDDLRATISELLERKTDEQAIGPRQLLTTFPNTETWEVPHTIWHTDIPHLPGAKAPGVQIFALLNSVRPGGGGTLAVAGSHLLLASTNERVRSKDVKKRLRREPWIHDLLSKDVTDRNRFLDEPSRIGDVDVQVVEMTGEPGDVFLMDMRLLHTLAPNALDTPRMMITQRFTTHEVMEQAYGTSQPRPEKRDTL